MASTSPQSAASAAPASGYVAGSGLAQVSFLALNQLITRGLTFAMNLYVARSVGPVAFGLQAIHLYLLNTIVLFIAREAGRKATLRYASTAPASAFPSAHYPRARHETAMVVNLAWMAVAGAVLLTAALTAWFSATAPLEAIPLGYLPCLRWYAVATVVELLGEPLYVVAQRRLLVGCRVGIDSAATLLRCAVTVVAIAAFDSGLMAFAYGQMAFALTNTALLYLYFLYYILQGHGASTVGFAHVSHVWPHSIPRDVQRALVAKKGRAAVQSTLLPAGLSRWVSGWMDAQLLDLYGWLLVQMLEKLALTEGEKAVMVSFHFDLDQQGVYGLIQNLGSLVARLLFAPLEDASGTEFSLLFASIADDAAGAAVKAVDGDGEDAAEETAPLVDGRAASSVSLRQRSLSVYSTAAHYLGVLLKLLSLISLLLLCFGPPYSFVLIDVLYGAKWSSTSAPRVLTCYVVYLGFMALNGLTEAFVTAVTSAQAMRLYNLLLLLFSAVYLSACALLLPVGAEGLIAANALNMSLRIAYSTHFIAAFFRAAPHVADDQRKAFPARILSAALPSLPVLLSALLGALLCSASSYALDVGGGERGATAGLDALWVYAPHLAVGAATGGLVLGAIYRWETDFLHHLLALVTRKKLSAHTALGSAAVGKMARTTSNRDGREGGGLTTPRSR